MKKLLAILPVLLLTSCGLNGARTPLGWCLWEIRNREGYEDVDYTYDEVYVKPTEKENPKIREDVYIITTYKSSDEGVMKAEWYCFIKYKVSIFKYIKPEEIVLIDCDVITGELYNGD